LQKGFRLQDFNMFGESEPGVNPFADTYSLSASGLGGDSFPTAQLTVSKNKLYDFRVNWRQSSILRVARERGADLIVLGVRPGDALATHRLGNVAYDVVIEAQCPVLTVRFGQLHRGRLGKPDT